MKSRADYDAALGAIRAVIAAWDPYGLLAGGAPADEFDQEIAMIAARVRYIESPESAAAQLSEVFGGQFGPEQFSIAACREPGQRLFEALRVSGVVDVRSGAK